MRGNDLRMFLIILVLSFVGGGFFDVGDANRSVVYSDLITFLSIVIGFEVASLSIIFNTPLKMQLYDRKISYYRTELHRLRDFYRFSIYSSLFYVAFIFILPDFSLWDWGYWRIGKLMTVIPIIFSSIYCIFRLCQDLFRIFVFPVR